MLFRSYNVSPYIERCAVSLFEQTFERIEFVFVDDCSPDDSIAILNEVAERYPERKPHIKLIRHTSNRGIGASRNTLLENASGEYLMWVDSDDFIELDMVETMIAKAYRTDADIVFCSYFQNSLERKQYVQKIAFSESKNRILDSSFEQPSLWNKMFKLNLLLKNNLCFPLTINYGEDLSFVPREIGRAHV